MHETVKQLLFYTNYYNKLLTQWPLASLSTK